MGKVPDIYKYFNFSNKEEYIKFLDNLDQGGAFVQIDFNKNLLHSSLELDIIYEDCVIFHNA